MKLRGTILLIGVFAALTAAYFYMLHAQKTSRQTAAEAKKMFVALAPEDVVALRIEQIDQRPVVGVRGENNQWTITDPDASIAASQPVWDYAAAGIASLMNERTIEEQPASLKPYELDEPRLAVEAQTRPGQKIRLIFGKMEPTQQCRYAQLDGGPVFLAKEDAFFLLNRSLLELRQRYIFTFDETGLMRVEFVRVRRVTPAAPEETRDPAASTSIETEESIPVVLERSPRNAWRLVKPVEAPADQEAVNEFVRQLQFATALRYIETPESLADYGLDPPLARISVWTDLDGPPQTVFLGAVEHEQKGGGLFMRRSDSTAVFTVDRMILDKMPKSPEAFREKRLFSKSAGSLSRIRYQDNNGTFTLAKDPVKGWRMIEPPADDTDQFAVSQYIAFLTTLDVMGFPGDPQPAFGLDPPTSQFTFAFDDGSESSIKLGAATADGLAYYATQDTGQVVTLSSATGKILVRTPFDFRGKTLLASDPETARSLALTLDGEEYAFERAAGGWRVRAPANKVWDSPSDMQALLEAIATVKAERQETETTPDDLSPYGLDAPTLALRVASLSKDGKQSVSIGPIAIGAPAPDDPRARFATAKDTPGVYRVSQDVLDNIREALKGLRTR